MYTVYSYNMGRGICICPGPKVRVIEETTHLYLGNLPTEIGTDIMQGVQELRAKVYAPIMCITFPSCIPLFRDTFWLCPCFPFDQPTQSDTYQNTP